VHIRGLPEGKLTGEQRQNLALARAIAGPKVMSAELRDGSIVGAYDPISDMIFIHPVRLSSLPTTMDTVIHELAHRRSRKPDETPEFKEALKSVMIGVIEKVKRGEFDELL